MREMSAVAELVSVAELEYDSVDVGETERGVNEMRVVSVSVSVDVIVLRRRNVADGDRTVVADIELEGRVERLSDARNVAVPVNVELDDWLRENVGDEE